MACRNQMTGQLSVSWDRRTLGGSQNAIPADPLFPSLINTPLSPLRQRLQPQENEWCTTYEETCKRADEFRVGNQRNGVLTSINLNPGWLQHTQTPEWCSERPSVVEFILREVRGRVVY